MSKENNTRKSVPNNESKYGRKRQMVNVMRKETKRSEEKEQRDVTMAQIMKFRQFVNRK